MSERQHRAIRSFTLRQGRLTPGQQKALADLWPRFGLEPGPNAIADSGLDLSRPLLVEIGFGNGEALAQMAGQRPEANFIGIEVHGPGVGHVLQLLAQRELDNVRIFRHDAMEVLGQALAPASLDGVHLFFPDPWPKARHHKRRIVNPGFLSLLADKLKPSGYFHAATDWRPYADWMLERLAADQRFSNANPNGGFTIKPDWRPLTKFERRGLTLGHEVFDLLFYRDTEA
ncbi:MAG: tRNA (guanosine(46)-N7)-methyltransferase TrmB [Methylococcales bacterium]|nr:tRNA (guanosine(46)-N7)-methyltransferase TrmB [Methylococcales bacterium]